MQYTAHLKKMMTELQEEVQYYLLVDKGFLHLNQLIHRRFEIHLEGTRCLSCSADKKRYRQGFCYACFFSSAQAGDWIIRPELSKAHLDIEDRDLDFEKQVQLQPHVVYLALSGNVKVGVTRKTQLPTRWIDQGAVQALEMVEVPNRYLAGITEVALKAYVSDKTSWRQMLKNDLSPQDLLTESTRLKAAIPEEAQAYYIPPSKLTHIRYPVSAYPKKIQSLHLEKTPAYSGILTGIKGQYLLFEDQTVFNVRSHEGCLVRIKIS